MNHYRRALPVSAIAAILFLGLYLVAAGFLQTNASGQKLVITGVSSSSQKSAGNTPAPKAVAPAASAGTHAQPVTAKSCSPVSFGVPAAIGLGSKPAGLSVAVDSTTEYRIFGITASQLRSQLQKCGPGSSGSTDAEFTGQTDYSLDWQYDLVAANDECTLSDVKVGLRTGTTLPYWLPATGAANGLTGRWQAFANGLRTHENGHVAIDKSYASQLLTDLKSLPAMPCEQVTAKVHAVTSADSAALDQANTAYDTSTNHGATQGAVLPAS